MKNWFKRKSTRRILSFALSIVMVLTLLPMPSVAAESTVEPDAPVESQPAEKTEKVITDWAWVDPDEWLDETGSFAMPGVTEDCPAYFEDVVEYLPTQITALIDGGEVTLDLGVWECDDYPMETGTSQGEFVFTATLPEGYVLADGSNTLSLPVTVAPMDLSDGEDVSGYNSGGNGTNEAWDDVDSKGVRNWNKDTSAFQTGVGNLMHYRKITQKYNCNVEWTKYEYLWKTNENPAGVTVYPGYCVHSQTAEITGTLTIKDDIHLILCAEQTNADELPDMVLTVGSINIDSGKTLTIWTKNGGWQGGKLIVKGDISGGGTLVVRDGYVEAQNITCKFSTGGSANGKESLGVVKANSISDQSDKANWGGVIVENGAGRACGTAAQELIYDLQCDTLTIDSGKTLTVGWDGYKNSEGNNIGARHKVKLIANNLVNNGTLINKAKLYYNTLSGSGTTDPSNGRYGYYKNENGQKVYRPFTLVTSDITELTNTAETNDGWYLVSGNVEWANRVAVAAGKIVNLVLADGCTLTAKEGITVGGSGKPTLIIWCQEAGTGTLNAQTSNNQCAAIGTNGDGTSTGVITIHGGNINAEYTGSDRVHSENCGLGGYQPSASCTVTINGGTINTPALVADNLTINGGTITVLNRISGRFLVPATDGGSTFVTADSNWAGGKTNRRGLFFFGDTGEVCTGSGTELTLARAMEVPAGKTLVIPQGKTLKAGSYLTNSGAVCVGGAYTGSLSGDIYYRLSVEGGTAASAGNIKTIGDVTYVKAGSTVTLTPGAAPAGKRFDHWNPPAGLTLNNANTFTMPAKTVDISAAYSDAVVITEQPEPTKTIIYGDKATLSVTAQNPSGGTDGITYQWYKGTEKLPNETSKTLSLRYLDASTQPYSFYCEVSCNGVSINSNTATVTVNKAQASVTINSDPSKTYDGTPVATPSYTVSGSGYPKIEYKLQSETVNAYTETPPTDAGSYTVRVTMSETQNYKGASDTKDFTISKATDNEWLTAPSVTNFTYGDNVTNPVTYQAKYGNDTVKVTYKKQGTQDTPSITVPTEAGTYDVTVSLAETADYSAPDPVQLKLTIRPKSLSDSDINVTLVGDTPVYDGTGKTRTVTVKFGETTLKEDTDYTLSGNTATTAGTHTLTVTGQGNYSGSTTKDWTIARTSITPTVTIADTVYGDTLNPGVNGNSENGAVTYTYYSDAACETVVTPKNVGTYYVRATIAETNNYQQATTTAKSFRITQRSVTVTITPNGGAYGDVTPAGATLNDVAAGDTVPVTLTYTGTANDGTSYDSTTAPSKAGTYTVTATISDGNYTLTGETTAQFVIEKATVTTPTLDSKTYTGETQTADIADTDRYTVTKNDGGIHAGSYDVVLTLRDSDNYKWDDANGKTTFRITQTDNTWTIAPAISGWTYGDTPGIPKGEAGFGTVTVEYTADGTTYSTTVPTKAGTYKARFTVADTGDIKGLSAEKTFTISKAPLTVTANDHTITYGDAPANNGVTYEGFVNSEDASVLVGTPAYTYSYSRYGNVGSYTITPKGLTSDNYDITFENGTLAVNRKEIGITWGETSLSYTGTAQVPTATATGLVNGDTCDITVIGKKTDVGDNYTAMANSLSNNNYKLPENKNNNCIFSITKVAPTFTAPTGKTVVYTGGELALAEGGETAHGTMQYRLSEDDEWSTSVPNGTDIGTYTIYYQVVGDKNHTNTEPGSVTAKILPFAIEKAPQNTTIDYGEDTTLTFETTTALEGEVTYHWYLVTDSEGGYVELPGETGNTLTLTKNNAGEYTYVCIVSCGEYSETSEEITVTVAPGEISVGTDVDLSGFWLEGGEAPASAGQTQILERSPSSRLLTKYTTSDSTQGDAYPSGMKVYRLDEDNQPVEIEELGNLLQYSGCSIRVTGKKGIRMITSLTEEAKTALTKSNLAGYTLEEYGTVVQWKDDLNGASLTLANGNHNYAYKKGVSDPVFANLSDLTQYTNVLVWESLTNEQLGKDIVMRPYIILKDADGETVTLYGGCVSRSIGYIAYQNRTVFNPGTADYKYVWDIIHAVYGTRYDSDYKG